MTSLEIKQKQSAIDAYAKNIGDTCMAAAFIAMMLIGTLLGYEAFNV